MYESRPFEHAGKKYEVRIATDGCTTYVRVFKDGKPANGYTYQVDHVTQVDAQMSGVGTDLVEVLVTSAKNDVQTGVWERYLESVGASEQHGA